MRAGELACATQPADQRVTDEEHGCIETQDPALFRLQKRAAACLSAVTWSPSGRATRLLARAVSGGCAANVVQARDLGLALLPRFLLSSNN